MYNISKFNQVVKEYEQKDISLQEMIKQFKNYKLSNELIGKYSGFSNYPFGHYYDEDHNNIQNKWNKFKPTDTYESIPLIKVGEFKNWINDKKYSEDIPVLLPLITQDKEIQFNRNIVFRNCKNIEKIFKNIITRLMTSIPPNQLKLHLFDNVSKGESFISFTSLSNLIIENGVLYKEDEIYKKLQVLHDKVIFLKQSMSTKYNNIDEFNMYENQIKEPYNFLFISNFPKGFNKSSLELLKDIMKYGNKVGFEVILDLNYRYALEDEIIIDEFLDLGFLIDYYRRFKKDIYKFTNFKEFSEYWFDIERFELNENLVLKIIDSINNHLHNKEIKPLSFSSIKDSSYRKSDKAINIPIGYMNEFDKALNFDLNEVYHCIIGGATGSGKTVLLHTLINSLAYHYSPEDVELYLLDYKEGTEFKIYENLAHCSLLSIASDIVFGISVLERVLIEIENRGSKFKEYDVSNIQNYREVAKKTLPRIVIIIDEFQVLLTSDNKNKEKAKQYIDDIVRRGRSFGIHLVLSTQTLQGVELSTSTKSNTGLRIALKMNPEDASKILSDKNAEKPITLKLGEAIYNNSHGHISADKKFQVAYIEPNTIKQNIEECNKLYKSSKKPIIYNGNKEADPNKNRSFINRSVENRIYIGEASFLSEDHKYFTLEEEYGENILICGTNIEDAVKVNLSILYSLSLVKEEVEIYNFNFLNKSNQYKNIFEEVSLPNNKTEDLEEIIIKVYEEFENRRDEKTENYNKIIFSIFNLQNARKLYSQSSIGKEKNELLGKIHTLLNDGAEFRIHILVYSPMYSQLDHFKIKHINFSTKIIVNGGDSHKLIGQTIQSPNLKNGNALISCNTNEEEYEELRLYNFNKLKELINAK